jgi:hypothetical protein
LVQAGSSAVAGLRIPIDARPLRWAVQTRIILRLNKGRLDSSFSVARSTDRQAGLDAHRGRGAANLRHTQQAVSATTTPESWNATTSHR